MELLDLGREEHAGLARRIAAADQRDLLARAELGLDRRGPIGDAGALELVEIGDVGPAVARARRDHDRARRASSAPLARSSAKPGCVRSSSQWSFVDRERDGELGAEFGRLGEGAAGERLAGNAGREAEIILDPRRRARLAAERARVEHEHRQAFGRAIDRGGEAGGPGADDRHVIDLVGIELGRDAEAGRRPRHRSAA